MNSYDLALLSRREHAHAEASTPRQGSFGSELDAASVVLGEEIGRGSGAIVRQGRLCGVTEVACKGNHGLLDSVAWGIGSSSEEAGLIAVVDAEARYGRSQCVLPVDSGRMWRVSCVRCWYHVVSCLHAVC